MKNDRLDKLAREAAARLPRDMWVVAGASSLDTYPCRCHERPSWAKTCSAAWCPCAGSPTDGKPVGCCAFRYGPADVVMAKAAWELRKRQQEEMLE